MVISVLFVVCVVAWLTRIRSPTAAYRAIRAVPDRGLTPAIWVLAAAGGVLCGASPDTSGHDIVGSDTRVRTKASLDAPVAAHLLFASSRRLQLALRPLP
ncbi:MAG: hypothetical protein ACLP8S_03105 [Solirubrobacteraceae bacterium]